MEIEQRNIATLIPYARNAKKHDENQITQIAASIKEFGFLDPVEIDPSGLIIAGHGRVLAAQKLGLTEIPVVVHDHLNDNQRKAYTLLNNRLTEIGGGWDTEMLKLELDSLPTFDFSCFDGFFDVITENKPQNTDEVIEHEVIGDNNSIDNETVSPPEEFKEYGEDIETDYCCPKCGYEWSGK